MTNNDAVRAVWRRGNNRRGSVMPLAFSSRQRVMTGQWPVADDSGVLLSPAKHSNDLIAAAAYYSSPNLPANVAISNDQAFIPI